MKIIRIVLDRLYTFADAWAPAFFSAKLLVAVEAPRKFPTYQAFAGRLTNKGGQAWNTGN
ncbi:MAG TPA: hypothetical protein VK728_02445 [Candidatus Sulfotelmatobacter sp.]|jgi:hypothetical protein|nr:hypothetical protein [Candidatus Sulfotelmatobacter sp.]